MKKKNYLNIIFAFIKLIKTCYLQEISDVGDQIDTVPVGSIACDSVITAVIYWQEKLFVGQSDTVIKVINFRFFLVQRIVSIINNHLCY